MTHPSTHELPGDIRTFVFGRFVVSISAERLAEDQPLRDGHLAKYVRLALLRLIGEEEQALSYLAFIHAYMLRWKDARLAILDAHGYDEGDEWVFDVGDRKAPVQMWVSANDGQHAVLLLHVCNPGHYCIFSERSLVLVPRTDLSLHAQLGNRVRTELYVPRRGVVDNLNLEAEFARIAAGHLEQRRRHIREHFGDVFGL